MGINEITSVSGLAGEIRMPTSETDNTITYMDRYGFQDPYQVFETAKIVNMVIKECSDALLDDTMIKSEREIISSKLKWAECVAKDIQTIQYLLGPIRIATSSTARHAHTCANPWPADCKVQCGDKGLVFGKTKNYTTAFFEAFPKDPDTFIRGEGNTILEAENQAWEKFQRQASCENHEFERRGYKNGVGFCKHCGLYKSSAFEPSEKCYVCEKPTFYIADKQGNFYCEEHKKDIPEKDIPDYIKEFTSYEPRESSEPQVKPLTPLEKINQLEGMIWYWAWRKRNEN